MRSGSASARSSCASASATVWRAPSNGTCSTSTRSSAMSSRSRPCSITSQASLRSPSTRGLCFERLDQRGDRPVERGGKAESVTDARDCAVDEVDLAPSACHEVEQHRRSRVRDPQSEVANVGGGVVEAERDVQRLRDLEGLTAALRGDRPRGGARDHLPDRAAEHGAGAAEGDIADELLPDEPVDVVIGLDVEAGRPPDLRDRLDPRRHRALALAEPDELESVMMDVARLDDRGAEAAGDADRYSLLSEDGGCDVGPAEAVLDRKHERLRSDEHASRLGRRLHVHRLRGDDDELCLADLGCVRGRMNPDDTVAACALDAKASLADRVAMLLPAVDGPDLVPGAREQAGVDGAHRSGPGDGNFHGRTMQLSP